MSSITKIFRLLFTLDLIASAYWSSRTRALFLIGRGSKVITKSAAVIKVARGSRVTIGLEYGSPIGARINLAHGAVLEFCGSHSVKKAVNIAVRDNAKLTLGEGGFVNEDTRITVTSHVELGPGTFISHRCTIIDSDDHRVAGGVMCAPIKVGAHCWIGCNVVLLKGSDLCNDTIVAAGTVGSCRTKEKGVIVAGSPPTIIRKGVKWH